jgi:hypothetical protein
MHEHEIPSDADKETNPLFAENARYRMGEVCADLRSS